jgi:hypothetical protein
MELRPERSEKRKELIKDRSKSDIFNTETEYYKTENIYPISPKPTEIGKKLIDFTPKYPNMTHFQRYFDCFLSARQKRDNNILNLRPSHSLKHMDLEGRRSRYNDINGYCLDKKGHFSASKLYILDIYGSRDILNNNNKSYLFTLNDRNIKERRKYLEQKSQGFKNINSYKQKAFNNNHSVNTTNVFRNNNNELLRKNRQLKKDNFNKDIEEIDSLITQLSSSQKKETLNYIKNLLDKRNENKELNKNGTSDFYKNLSNKSYIKKNPNITNFLKNNNKDFQINEKYNTERKKNNKNENIDIKKTEKTKRIKRYENFEKRIEKAKKDLNKINLNNYFIPNHKKKRKGTPGNELKQKQKKV